MKTIVNRFKFLWSRLPFIALYFVASLVIIQGVHYVTFKYVLPTNYFIRNFSMTATNTVEHTDVPIRVCRDRRGNFRGDVFRTIRVIPDGKTDDDAVFAGKYELKQVSVDGDRCENLQITTAQYSHNPGRYVISTNFCFKSQYNRDHCIEYKSNVYEIRAATITDFEAKIKELEQQIEALKRTQASIMVQTTQPRQSSSGSSSGSSSSPSSSVSATAPNQPNNPTPTNPTPTTPTTREVCTVDSAIPLLNIPVRVNCRQVPV